MNFIKRWKGNFPQMDFSGKLWVKALKKNLPSVIMGSEMIQNPP
jgi:hypothetical protein